MRLKVFVRNILVDFALCTLVGLMEPPSISKGMEVNASLSRTMLAPRPRLGSKIYQSWKISSGKKMETLVASSWVTGETSKPGPKNNCKSVPNILGSSG